MARMTPIRGLVLVLAMTPALSGCLVIGAMNATEPASIPEASAPAATVAVPTSSPPTPTAPSSASSPTPPATPTPPAAPAPPALPDGTKWATADNEQLRFAVASSWVEINPSMVAAGAPSPEVKKLAKDLGVSSGELLGRFESIEIAYLAAPVNGYSSNISMSIETLASLPDDEWVKSVFAQSGKVKVVSTERVTTLVGPALRINGSATFKGVTIPLATVIVDVGRHSVVLEVAARKRSDVDKATNYALTTLHSI